MRARPWHGRHVDRHPPAQRPDITATIESVVNTLSKEPSVKVRLANVTAEAAGSVSAEFTRFLSLRAHAVERGKLRIRYPGPGEETHVEIPFEEVIATQQRLRELHKPPSQRASNKVIDHIDDVCRRFIAACP